MSHGKRRKTQQSSGTYSSEFLSIALSPFIHARPNAHIMSNMYTALNTVLICSVHDLEDFWLASHLAYIDTFHADTFTLHHQRERLSYIDTVALHCCQHV